MIDDGAIPGLIADLICAAAIDRVTLEDRAKMLERAAMHEIPDGAAAAMLLNAAESIRACKILMDAKLGVLRKMDEDKAIRRVLKHAGSEQSA